MSKDHDCPSVLIWTDSDRASLVQRVLGLMGSRLKSVAVGGPRTAAVVALADQLDCDPIDDPRKLIIDRSGRYLFLAGSSRIPDAEVAAAVDRGVDVLAIEPIAEGLDCPILNHVNDGQSTKITPVPAFEHSPGWLASAEPWEALGKLRLIQFISFGPALEGSLYARVADGWRTLLRIAGLAESVDASLVGPLAQIPESPRGMTGHLAVHARLPDSCAAVVRCSDRLGGGGALRSVEVFGDEGRLVINDHSYALYGAAGQLLDSHETARENRQGDEKFNPAAIRGPIPEVMAGASLIAFQWQRLLDQPDPKTAPSATLDESQVLACCLACMLSARTGQPETPSKFLKLHRR